MKNRRVLQSVLILSLFVFQMACHKDKPVINPEEVQIAKISGIWAPGTITKDNLDITSLFPGFTLELKADKSFVASNANGLFSATGTWDFKTGDLNVLEMDGLEVTLSNLTTSTMNMSFTKPVPGGRMAGLDGQYLLALVR